MKKYLFLLVMISSVLIFSCTKSDDTKPDDETKDFYYVRYEVLDDYYTNYGYKTHITVNTDKGYDDFSVVRTFDETFGPVDNSFVPHIKVNTTPSNYHLKTVRIYLSKNNGPFALKAYKIVKDSAVNLSYTIDF